MTQTPTSATVTTAIRSACAGFLARHGIAVADAHDPVSIARSILVYMGGEQHAINGEAHALRLIETFYKRRIGRLPADPPPQARPQATSLTKKQRRALAQAQRHGRRKNMLDREYERIMGPITP